MRGKPPGSIVTLWCASWTYPDGTEVPRETLAEELPGDFLRSASGACYEILEFRPTKREGAKLRGKIVCTKLEYDAVQIGEEGVHEWSWHARPRAAVA